MYTHMQNRHRYDCKLESFKISLLAAGILSLIHYEKFV